MITFDVFHAHSIFTFEQLRGAYAQRRLTALILPMGEVNMTLLEVLALKVIPGDQSALGKFERFLFFFFYDGFF